MKCPECSRRKLKRQPDLQTVRTLANGRSVRRERACPRCIGRLWTVELIEADYQGELSARDEEARRARLEAAESADVLEEVKAAFEVLKTRLSG